MLHTADMSNNDGWSNVCVGNLFYGVWHTHLDLHRLSYTWINQERKNVHLPAPTYIDYVMTWIQNLLNDEATFPTKSGDFFIAFHLI